MTTRPEPSNGQALAGFIATARERKLPPPVLNAARLCLADWVGVALGGRAEGAARVVREVVAGWNSTGSSTVVFGPTPYNMGGPDEYVTVEDLGCVAKVHTLAAFDFLTNRA